MPRLLVVLVCLCALVAGACARGEVAPLPKPPKPPETSSSLPPVDLSGVNLPPVKGATTTTFPPIPGGKATLSGVVVGPDGPVPGAIVHAERIVGDRFGVLEITTGPDGAWKMENIFGGRYRVRAWKPSPDNLAATQAEVFFLPGDEKRDLSLRLQRFQGMSFASDIAPRPPIVDERAALVIQLTELSVDANGIVRSIPISGVGVELFGPGEWAVLTTNPVITGSDGRARWELRCGEEGEQPLSVVLVDGQSFPVDTPPCSTFEEPPATTTTTVGDGEPAPTTTTTTSRGGGGGGNRPTTTTTRAA